MTNIRPTIWHQIWPACVDSWWVWWVATWLIQDMPTSNCQLLHIKSRSFVAIYAQSISVLVLSHLAQKKWPLQPKLPWKNTIERQKFGMAQKPVLNWLNPIASTLWTNKSYIFETIKLLFNTLRTHFWKHLMASLKLYFGP